MPSLTALSMLLLSFFSSSLAYLDGARKESCYDHAIVHFPPFQTDPSPLITCTNPCAFQLDILGSVPDLSTPDMLSPLIIPPTPEVDFVYQCDTTYKLQVRQAGINGFQGFLVQARNNTVNFEPDSPIYGEWVENSTYLYKPLYCKQSMNDPMDMLMPNSATQRMASDIESQSIVPLYWTSPPASEDPPIITFWYSIVQQLSSGYYPEKGPVGIPHPNCTLPHPPTTMPHTTMIPTTVSSATTIVDTQATRQPPEDTTDSYLVLANGRFIQRLDIGDFTLKTLINESTNDSTGIDFDYRRGYLYWSDWRSQSIFKSNLHGGDVFMIADIRAGYSLDIAIDWITNKLYWTAEHPGTINVFDLDSDHHRTLFTRPDVGNPSGIALDPIDGYMFWTDYGTDKIERASMDGAEQVTIVDTNLHFTYGITIDLESKTLYWCDAAFDKIESSNYDGTNRQLVISTREPNPFSITVFNGTLYWTDYGVDSVFLLPLSSNMSREVYSTLTNNPWGIEVVSPLRQPLTQSPCGMDNGNCDHLCLINSNRSFTCACADNYTLADNSRDCIYDAINISTTSETATTVTDSVTTVAPSSNSLPTLQPSEEFNGCPLGPDSVWGIEWPNTNRDTVSTQRCPGQSDTVTGQASRHCDSNGEWSEVNVLNCQDMDFVNIVELSSSLVLEANRTSPEQLIQQTVDIAKQLANITEPDDTPLLPTALNATNMVISNVLTVLEEVGNGTATDINQFVLDVFNNILERNNSISWMSLQQADAGSQVLLSNAERFGALLARSQNASGSSRPERLSRPNIAISARQYELSQGVTIDDLKFPQEEDLVNYSLSSIPAVLELPAGLLLERLNQQNDGDGGGLPIVFILFQNLEAFLPSSVSGLSNGTRGASVVISSQVGGRGVTGPSQTLLDSPVSLNFTFSNIEDSFEYHCVFWNFSEPIGNGGWISDGVSTVGNSTDGLTTTVQCASTHLTSFAVLVDVAGGLTNISERERTALQVVSYIGCVISIISLITTVVFFLLEGKKLLITVHYFVHLNLAISLLLAYFVFIVGVETAVGSVGGCAFVAALLHYLFLSAFCWMMCEGVMLYLLLVVVFSRVAKSWWFFLLLGYLTPLPFVVITLAVRWQYYGVRDHAGNLQFCWLSIDEGTIFGFVAPMLMIILINVVFLGFALRALWNSQKSQVKRRYKDDDKQKQALHIAKSVFVASVILLPLLGLTWVFGLLTVNSNTTVFAWIFTILNSLQGLAILFFHVIRSDKVWSRIGSRISNFKQRILPMKYTISSDAPIPHRNTTKYKSKSTGDTGIGTMSSKSTTSQGGSVKADLSSKVSDIYSQAETKIGLSAISELPEEVGGGESPYKIGGSSELVVDNPSGLEESSEGNKSY